MLDFIPPTMAFKSFPTKPQPSLDDHEVLHATKEFQGLYSQYRELGNIDDPTYLSLTKNLMTM